MPILVITRSKEDNQNLAKQLVGLGLTIIDLPCIEFINPSDNYSKLDQAIRSNHTYDWIFFLSIKAADTFFSRLLELGGHLFHLSPHLKIACVGKTTADFVEKEIGFPVNFVPSKFNSETLAEEFTSKYCDPNPMPGADTLRVILPRAEGIEDDFVSQLSKQISIEICPAYQTICPESNNLEKLDKAIISGEEIFISISSSEICRNFAKIVGQKRMHDLLQRDTTHWLSIGPKTTRTMRNEARIQNIQEANNTSINGLLKLININHVH